MRRCWAHEARKRPAFEALVAQLKPTPAGKPMLPGSTDARGVSREMQQLESPDLFISYRIGEVGTEEIRALVAALEARQLKVFASDVSPGGAEQHVIAHALSTCKLAIILATNTYGYCTNALFCTSAEMNYIIGQNKAYYLIRMIPFGQSWAEPTTMMAFPPSTDCKVCSLNPTLSEQRPPTCVCMPVGARSCGCQATRFRVTWSTR